MSRKPRLTISQILKWADSHHRRTVDWPTKNSGPIVDAPHESWCGVNHVLRRGRRGLPGRSSLARLLAEKRGRKNIHDQPPLTVGTVLKWADAHFKRTGRWPHHDSGPVRGVRNETWANIDRALRVGRRGLPTTSLPRLLSAHRGAPFRVWGSPLAETQIIRWAKSHRARTGDWPRKTSGPIPESPGDTWANVNHALHAGMRGLPGGMSLLRLLADRCGMRHRKSPPRLSIAQILAWADAHRQRTGDWPTQESGPVHGVDQETWLSVDHALRRGTRGLPGGSSLAILLAEKRGRIHLFRQPPLSIQTILAWADAHRQRTGAWPHNGCGRVVGQCHERWDYINNALIVGRRGLPGGTSLSKILVEHRGKYDRVNQPPLTIKQILQWADAHFQREGVWPNHLSGPIPETPHQTWNGIYHALQRGRRGMRPGQSIHKVLLRHRGALYRLRNVPLKRSEILEWAAEHHELHGKLPTKDSGPLRGSTEETWATIDAALRSGTRGLRGKITLADFLKLHYVKPYPGIGRRLTERKILNWAESFRKRVGRWPTAKSAFTDPSRTEKWAVIDIALREGLRGLKGGSSLAGLLREHRRRSKVESSP